MVVHCPGRTPIRAGMQVIPFRVSDRPATLYLLVEGAPESKLVPLRVFISK